MECRKSGVVVGARRASPWRKAPSLCAVKLLLLLAAQGAPASCATRGCG
ncbi:hypothetical protein A2U01_0117049, partial [Trifolium medium]|nr:hypothetical protein [Trifolium medium]